MFQITNEEIPTEVLDLIPENIKLRDKLIRKINESYQYNFKVYNQVQKGDYSFVEKILESHIFHYC